MTSDHIEIENENTATENESSSAILSPAEKQALAQAQQAFISEVSAELSHVDLGPVTPLSIDLFNRIQSLVGGMDIDLDAQLPEEDATSSPIAPKRSLH